MSQQMVPTIRPLLLIPQANPEVEPESKLSTVGVELFHATACWLVLLGPSACPTISPDALMEVANVWETSTMSAFRCSR